MIKDGSTYSAVPHGKQFRLPTKSEPKQTNAELAAAISKAKKHVLEEAAERLKTHRLHMHRPKDPACDTCAEALSQKTPATRTGGDKTGSERGLVMSMDYIVGLPEDKDGNNAVLIMATAGDARIVDARACKDRSGKVALRTFQDGVARMMRYFPVGTKIARVHSDEEKAFVGGELKDYIQNTMRAWPTDTGGHDSNANAIVESAIKPLTRAVRVALLDCTGGRGRYQEIYRDLYEHAADVLNNSARNNGVIPAVAAGGVATDVTGPGFHVYGAKVYKYVPTALRDGKLDMPMRLMYWAGRSSKIANGHKVVSMEWNDRAKSYDLGPTEHVPNVLVHDTVFPLRLMPEAGGDIKAFDEFVDRLHPRSVVDDTYQVKAIVGHRWQTVQPKKAGGKRKKQLEFLVHWKGYRKNESTWEPHVNLKEAQETVDAYKKKYNVVSHLQHVNDGLLAVVELMHRHKLKCTVQQALNAYNLELDTVNGLRMVELDGEDRDAVLKAGGVPRLRMNPEPKPNRLKMRLLVRGDTEPKHLYEGQPTDSPTPMASSIKMLVALQDEDSGDDGDDKDPEVIGDISTAFLKSSKYGVHDKVRHVAYKAHSKAQLRVFRLTGALYGQVDAPMRWHQTVVKWMTEDMGFVQSKNDVCMTRK